MPAEDPSELERVDQEIRINELKEEAKELAGGQMLGGESDDCPPELAESFWCYVVDYEKAPRTSHFQQLLAAGMELPAPEAMTDSELSIKLWELIERLAGLRAFLSNTDHLSDRELYTHLWTETLHEAIADMPAEETSAWHIDVLGGCSAEDIHRYLKYYADERERRDWLERFPDDELPAHEDPPYDRDRRLPRSGF
jgi:hypothetical protein